MSVKILQSIEQNRAAREEMSRAGISYWPRRAPRTLLNRLLLRRAIPVGDSRKSWDVLETVRLLEARLPKDAPIIDLGAYASEVLCSLHQAGFTRLSGIDLDPGIVRMPFHEQIQYVVGDMMKVPFEDHSFAAVTSISAIEHGLQLRPLLAEVSRLLRAGGLFIASTDYWPAKIDTTGIRMYDLEWKIFSREEIEQLLAVAAEYGLEPIGELSFEADERPITAAGKHFTFAWMALEKRA
ncbi:MAG TPA: class I SAM-dependent methyltransferase [Thermoanaerobaculia bacterium]